MQMTIELGSLNGSGKPGRKILMHIHQESWDTKYSTMNEMSTFVAALSHILLFEK
jgi:hypothetical protein